MDHILMVWMSILCLGGNTLVLGRLLPKPYMISLISHNSLRVIKICFLGKYLYGDLPFYSQYLNLFKVVRSRNSFISTLFAPSFRTPTQNFIFQQNHRNQESDELAQLISFVAHEYLSPSYPDIRAWSLTSSCLLSIRSFRALSHSSSLVPFNPLNLIWKSKVPPLK